jgi:hypothetical protein
VLFAGLWWATSAYGRSQRADFGVGFLRHLMSILEAKIGIFLNPRHQFIVRFEMLRKPIIPLCVFAGFYTVFLANVRAGFVDAAFVVRSEKLANRVYHHVPGFAVDIK